MKSVIEFDTAIGTSNVGDEIIMKCLEEELAFLLDNSFVMRWGTHVKNLDKRRFIFGSQKLEFTYDADFKIVMGTNMLSRDIKKTQAQWPVGNLDSWIYENVILAGVGTTLGEGKTTNYSKKIYNRILRKDFYHSVRDEESKTMLEDMGFKAINTGCPTLWKFTPEFCQQIPTKKASRVIFSLSGYKNQRDRKKDQLLLDILRENYDELIFWCQTTRDELYLDTFEDVESIPRIYALDKYRQILDEGNIDYVGTRLHGGVYAMQRKVRSIIISIDHRAKGFHDTNDLIICERRDIKDKLSEMINSEFETKIRIPVEDIERFKDQFKVDYPKREKYSTHEDIWWIKFFRLLKKIIRIPSKIKKKTVEVKKKTVKKLKSVKRKLVKKLKKAKRKISKKLKRITRLPNKCIRKIKKKLYSIKRKRFMKYIENHYSKEMASNPIEKGMTMFFSFQGDYTCNPKYIAEEMKARKLGWKQVWVTLKDVDLVREQFPEDVEVVRFNSKEYYDAMSRTEFFVDNAFNFEKGYILKKEGQKFFETMHGSLGIKKIGPDVVNDEARNARGYQCGEVTDFAISNSSFETMVYETSFWKKETIVELGHARNDIFFLDDEKNCEIRKKVCEYFDTSSDCKLALYAPTFRNEQEASDFEPIDYEELRETLEERFGGKWIILSRAHHSAIKKMTITENSFVKNANEYPDIQELMIAIDFAITDYSSWIFDYVLTKKNGLLYVPDLENYLDNRGFYYPITEAPYPIAISNEAMAEQIRAFDEDAIEDNINVFLERRGCIDDGKASAHIVDLMEKLNRELS